MRKILFLFYGSMYLIEQIEGNETLENKLDPGMSEQEALTAAKEIIDSMIDTYYNLSVIKMTFRPGACQKEIEDYLDGFQEGAHFEEYDGSGNAQDYCSFILQEDQTKMKKDKTTERNHIIGYLHTVVTAIMKRIDKDELDFSEPYIFNNPPDIIEAVWLSKIVLKDDVLYFEGQSDECLSVQTTFKNNQDTIEDKCLEQIRDFFLDCETYQYIVEYFCGVKNDR